MSVRSQNWYDLNEARAWPVDDTATLLSDDGTRLPNDVIADVYLRFPEILGDRAFISTLTVSTRIVTVTFLGSGSGFTPMASISLPRPVEPYRQYELESLYPGVGGWMTFGDGINDLTDRSWRFSSSIQTLLLAQAARRYRPLPVSSVGVEGSDAELSGIVKLLGGNDITTVVEERLIEGVLRDVAVVKLLDKQEESTRNLQELYAGACGQRPESGNCTGPAPIEFVNTVAPDCCGNLSIEFQGCGDLSSITGECGVVIDCGFGLAEACVTPDRLPDSTGRLPNEYDDQCVDFEEVAPTTPPTETAESYVYNTRDFSGSTLPYVENFSDSVADDITIAGGEFIIVVGGNGSGVVVDITKDGANPEVRVAFATAPPNQLPTQFLVTGNSVSAYNVVHTTTSVISSREVVTNVLHTSDGTGGTWEESVVGGSGSAGIVFESQVAQEDISLWSENLPVGFDTLHKRVETILSFKVGPEGTNRNGGLLLNYKDSNNFWLLEADWDAKAFRLVHKNAGLWQIRATVTVPELTIHSRYRLVAEILPIDEATSTSAIVDATLTGIDDATSYPFTDVLLPNYLPATGQFGLYANRSLTWFEELRVSDHNPS